MFVAQTKNWRLQRKQERRNRVRNRGNIGASNNMEISFRSERAESQECAIPIWNENLE